MKNFYFETKTLKRINGKLRRIGLDDFQLEIFPTNDRSVDFDWWLNQEETYGASVVFYRTKKGFEAFVTKYTINDIRK